MFLPGSEMSETSRLLNVENILAEYKASISKFKLIYLIFHALVGDQVFSFNCIIFCLSQEIAVPYPMMIAKLEDAINKHK